MRTIKRNKSIGLDVGQTSTKVVCVSRSGRKAVLKRAEVFRLRDEGIVNDESEQFQAISGWLKDLKLLDSRMVLGLPQYMATTQLSDFAKGVRGAKLDGMVKYETTQLSGISDDVFIHDYAVLPAGNERQNPVLIGVCREANVEDYVGRAAEVSIQLEDVAMSGLAMANAFVQLRPKAWRSAGIQMLLDVGTEATTVVLLCAGQVLYIGGMMFGGANVTQELSQQLHIGLDEAERQKLNGEVDWASLNMAAMVDLPVAEEAGAGVSAGEGPALSLGSLSSLASDVSHDDLSGDDSFESPRLGLRLPELEEKAGASEEYIPMISELTDSGSEGYSEPSEGSAGFAIQGLSCFRNMVRELENCLEHWRSSELESLGSQPLEKIWLCGGGSQLDQVAAYLEVSQGCPVESFGPRRKKKEAEEPELVVAYGLGVQGLGIAQYPISLTPSALTWIRGKELRATYLVISFLLLLLSIGGWYYYRFNSLVESITALDEATATEKENVTQLGKLDGMKGEYLEAVLQVLPIVENNLQGERFLRLMTLLQEAVKNPELADCRNWCVYVADEESFRQLNERQEESAGKVTNQTMVRGNNPIRLEPTDDSGQEVAGWAETKKAEEEVHEVIALTPVRQYYVVGMIMTKHDNHNTIERDIMSKLSQSHETASPSSPLFFKDVQLMSESEREKCWKRAVFDWESTLSHMRTTEAFKSYNPRPFFLRLTVRDAGIEVPGRNPLTPPSRSKKRKK